VASALALRDQPFKALRVELAVLDANEVSGSTRLQHSGTEHPAQPGDEDLKCLASRCRRGFAPAHIDDPLGGHDLIGMKKKQADKHFRAVPTEVQRTALVADAERAENPKVHGASP
jgi:hypothetical protein